MTMTIEETTTTTSAGTLGERRNAARLRLELTLAGLEYPATDVVFNIPAGYRIVTDTDYQARHTGERFVVSEVSTDGLGTEERCWNIAARLGLAISGVVATSDRSGWVALTDVSGTRTIPACHVTGAWVRDGVYSAPNEGPSTLVCFADGTIGRWHVSRTDRPRGHSLEVVLWNGTGEAPSAMDFDNRGWVPVEEDTPAGPFSGIPAGWKIDPDTPDRTITSGRDLYITSIHPSFLPERADKAGTIQSGFYSAGEWIFITSGNGYYANAALVNPDIEPGQHYYLERTKEVAIAEAGAVLRRMEADGSIGGILSTRFREDRWIRVVRDESETSLQPGAFPFPVGATRESPTLGLEDSTNPELNPAPVAGGVYVTWAKSWTPGGISRLRYCIADASGGLRFVDGGAFADGGAVTRSSYQATELVTLSDLEDNHDWIKAAPKRPEFAAGEVTSFITGLTDTINQRKETYSDALNELADEHDWCSEFESVVQAMGFPGRTKKKQSYNVEVSANFEWEDDSPSSNMDRRVESDLFSDNVSGLSLTNMTMSGRATVTILVEDVEVGVDDDEDERVSEALTETMIRRRLVDMMGGVVTVEDYDIESHEVADD